MAKVDTHQVENLGVYSNNSGFKQKGLKSTGMIGPPFVWSMVSVVGETRWERLRGPGRRYRWLHRSGGGVVSGKKSTD